MKKEKGLKARRIDMVVERVHLERQYLTVRGREAPLQPGMTVTADIRTGERRLLEYVLGLMLRYRDESLRER